MGSDTGRKGRRDWEQQRQEQGEQAGEIAEGTEDAAADAEQLSARRSERLDASAGEAIGAAVREARDDGVEVVGEVLQASRTAADQMEAMSGDFGEAESQALTDAADLMDVHLSLHGRDRLGPAVMTAMEQADASATAVEALHDQVDDERRQLDGEMEQTTQRALRGLRRKIDI